MARVAPPESVFHVLTRGTNRQEIVEDLEAALEQFGEIAEDPGEEKDEPQKNS